jgi:hypothetical protein
MTMELWEKAFKIMGKSKGARLMVLGLLLMVTGGGPYYLLQLLGISEPVFALLFVFGILSFVIGLALYTEEGTPPSRRRRRARSGFGQ